MVYIAYAGGFVKQHVILMIAFFFNFSFGTVRLDKKAFGQAPETLHWLAFSCHRLRGKRIPVKSEKLFYRLSKFLVTKEIHNRVEKDGTFGRNG